MEEFLSVVVGVVAVPIIQIVKRNFNLDGRAAMVLAAGLSAVIAVGALFLYGRLALADFTLENFASTFGLVLSTATIVYRLITEKA